MLKSSDVASVRLSHLHLMVFFSCCLSVIIVVVLAVIVSVSLACSRFVFNLSYIFPTPFVITQVI